MGFRRIRGLETTFKPSVLFNVDVAPRMYEENPTGFTAKNVAGSRRVC